MKRNGLEAYAGKLVQRILRLDAEAYQEFALISGPILLQHLVRKGIPQPEAERMSAEAVHTALGQIRDFREGKAVFLDWVASFADRGYEHWLRKLCGLQHDLEDAAKTQAALMPASRPTARGLEMYFCHKPLRMLTGDFCEVRNLAAEQTLLSIGDASGKGTGAALYGTLAISWLRAFAWPEARPAELLLRLDSALKQFPIGTQYATLLLSTWYPDSSHFVISNAGGPPPALVRNGELSWVQVSGTAVGWPFAPQFDEMEVAVSRGDLLVFYSDGIPDQVGPDDQTYGDERLPAAIRAAAWSEVEEVARKVMADLELFRGACDQSDDQMLLVVRVL